MTAEIEGFLRDAARKRGIAEDTAVKVARSEGGVDEYAKLGDFSGAPWYSGKSWWPLQLHYGGAGYESFGNTAGMGNGFTKLTGWQPGDPKAWRDSIRYALNRAKASGWGAWYGAAAVGVGQWDGIDRSAPWDANAEAWDFEGDAGTLIYNPSQPPERQIQSWVCSIRATSWILKSLGLPVDIGALQGEMAPEYVNADVGLKDRRGYGVAEVLKAHLPSDWDDRVHVFETMSWPELCSLAGRGPIALGLHGAYHWLNVAAPQADGSLSSPNPAPKYPDAAPIGDVLTEDEFNRYGPASAVWVNAAPTVIDRPTPLTRADIDSAQAQVAAIFQALRERVPA